MVECRQRSRRSTDRTLPCEGRNAGSIPAEGKNEVFDRERNAFALRVQESKDGGVFRQ